MTRTFTIKKGQRPTEEQMKEVREAAKMPIVFDENCPELSPALQKAFKSALACRKKVKKRDSRN